MKRRIFAAALAGSAIGGIAGCFSTEPTPDIKDTDGDGVIDSKDYAPRDSSVQFKEDVFTPTTQPTQTSRSRPNGQSLDEGASNTDSPTASPTTTATSTRSPTPTPTSTPTPTPTPTATPTATPTPTPTKAARIEANYEPIELHAIAYLKWYSRDSARIRFNADEYDRDVVGKRQKLLVLLNDLVSHEVMTYDTTDSFRITGGWNEREVSYSFSRSELDDSNRFNFSFLLMNSDDTVQEAADSKDVTHLCETDALRLNSDNHLEKNPLAAELDTLREDGYSRINGEGMYAISVKGQVNFLMSVYKRAYLESNEKATMRSQYVVREAYRSGLAEEFATILDDAAEDNGYTGPREKVNYAIKAIQAFPYVPDSVDNDFDDYSKYPIETIVEAGGDCEDTAILLASALVSQPFGYGCALLFLPYDNPDHVAVGIKGNDEVNGYYYEYDGTRYYYIETTGEGWELGEIPSEYEGVDANVVVI